MSFPDSRLTAVSRRWRIVLFSSIAACVAAAFVACGGGGDGGGGGFGSGNFGAENTPAPSGSSNTNNDSRGDGSGETGPAPDVAGAVAGEARIDVEGRSIVYGGGEQIYYMCDTSEGVFANFQTSDGHDLSFQYRDGFGLFTARDQENDLYYAT